MFSFYQLRPSEIEVSHYKRHALRFAPHLHNNFELFYMIKGKQDVSVMDKRFTLCPGDCAVIFPNTVHSYDYPDGEPGAPDSCEYLLIFISRQVCASLFPEAVNTHIADCIVKKHEIGENAALALSRIYGESSLTAQLGWAFIILSYLLPPVLAHGKENSSGTELISEVLSYVTMNFRQSLTLDLLSDELNVSKYTISRIFSDRIRISFRTYLGMLRADCAAELIRLSDRSFTEIAAEAGFESPRTFYRVFRNCYGISPAEYRRIVRGEGR